MLHGGTIDKSLLVRSTSEESGVLFMCQICCSS